MANSSVKKIFSSIFGFFTNKLTFCAAYFTASLVRAFPVAITFIDPILKLIFLWGIALMVWDFFTERAMFRGYRSVLVVAFLAFNVISTLLNPAILYTGVKHVIYNAFFLLIFYPTGEKISLKNYKKMMIAVNDIYMVLTFIASIASFVMFIRRDSFSILVGTTTYNVGVHFNRLAGVYISANTGALMTSISFFMALITFAIDRRHFKKFLPFYIANAVVQMIFYSLTLSNGGYLAWIAGLLASAIVFAYPKFKQHCKTIVAVALAYAVFAGSFLALDIATSVSRKAAIGTATFVASIGKEPGSPSSDPNDEVVLERTDKGNELSNGRAAIWSAGIAVLKQKPLFGWGDSKFYEGENPIISYDSSVLSELQLKELKRCDGYMHNVPVHVAVCGGIIGLLALLAFAFAVGKKYISSLIKLYGKECYAAIAAVLVILVMLISQFAAEAHLLFVRSDAIAGLFWLYLGFGMFLIKKGERENAERFAFVCGTPLQVMNATSFVVSDEKGCKGKSDLFLYHEFNGSNALAEKIKQQGIFDNVYEFETISFSKGIANKLRTVLRTFFPACTLKKISIGKDKKFLKNDYKYMVYSFYTAFGDLLHNHYKGIGTLQIEDGLGSYITPDLEARYRSGLFDKINRFFLGGALSYHPEALYLNNPDFCAESPIPLRQINGISCNDAALSSVRRLFGYCEESPYAAGRVVYLDQPVYDRPESPAIRQNETSFLPLIAKLDPIVRLHPRQTENSYESFRRDTAGNMWELECANSIGDDHILMGLFSTAQFTPKMMFGKEPALVFLYKLFGCNFDNADEMVERVRAAYENKDKIIVVENEEELKAVLETIRKGDSFGK